MKRSYLRGVAPLAAALLVAANAGAQGRPSVRGFAADAYDPSPPGSDWYTTDSLDLRGALRPQAGLLTNWAYSSLLTQQNGVATRVLTDQVYLRGRASLVFLDGFRVGFDMPVALYEDGDAAISPRSHQATGDLRLDGDARLFGHYGALLRATAGLEVFAPTGGRNRDTSDGTVRVAPRVMFAGDAKAFQWAAKLSYMFRPLTADWQGRELGSQVGLALSAGLNVNDLFVLGPELHGSGIVTGHDQLRSRAVPIELLLGGRVRLATDFQVGTAIGGRVTDGDGAAKMRVIAIFEYAPDVCVDKDGDGICAYEDACPLVDGVRTNNRFTNGCPPKGPRVPQAPQPMPPKPETDAPKPDPPTR